MYGNVSTASVGGAVGTTAVALPATGGFDFLVVGGIGMAALFVTVVSLALLARCILGSIPRQER